MQRDIPDSAVEAAALAIWDGIPRLLRSKARPGTELAQQQEQCWKHARAALAAALPHLVAAEREACARVADGVGGTTAKAPDGMGDDWHEGRQDGALDIAFAIRARGDASNG